MRIFVSLIILCGFALGAGCQSSFVNVPVASSPVFDPVSTSVSASQTQEEAEMSPSPSTPVDAGLQALIEKVKADLAQRLSTPVTQINLVEVAAVEWSDSGLGCPQPGMDYLQVITPGYLIRLEANAQIYEYHSNRDLYFVLCDNSTSPSIPKP